MLYSLIESGSRRFSFGTTFGIDVVADVNRDVHPMGLCFARECHVGTECISEVLVDDTAERLLHMITQCFTDVCLMACD